MIRPATTTRINPATSTIRGLSLGMRRAFGEECSRNPSRREDGYCKRRRPHTRSMGLGAKEDAEETDEMDEDDERRDDARDGVGSAHGHRAICAVVAGTNANSCWTSIKVTN